jgi:tripartite-type tricarboxylate transporter receptor subunit TctC
MHVAINALTACITVAGFTSAGAVHAQTNYPAKPIRLIVPLAPRRPQRYSRAHHGGEAD